MTKNGNFWGAFKTADGASKFAQLQAAGPISATTQTAVAFNSATMMMAVVLYRFIRTFMPDYAVISVGQGNMYGHPHRETLDLLDDADVKVYRTDMNEDIIVHSDGKTVSIECSK